MSNRTIYKTFAVDCSYLHWKYWIVGYKCIIKCNQMRTEQNSNHWVPLFDHFTTRHYQQFIFTPKSKAEKRVCDFQFHNG